MHQTSSGIPTNVSRANATAKPTIRGQNEGRCQNIYERRIPAGQAGLTDQGPQRIALKFAPVTLGVTATRFHSSAASVDSERQTIPTARILVLADLTRGRSGPPTCHLGLYLSLVTSSKANELSRTEGSLKRPKEARISLILSFTKAFLLSLKSIMKCCTRVSYAAQDSRMNRFVADETFLFS